MNKKILAFYVAVFTFLTVHSQVQNPMKWTANYRSVSEAEGEITINATIEKGWHTYSQQANDAVPLPTLFSFKESKQYKLIGKTEENNAQEEFDAALGQKLSVFTDKAEFTQKIKLITKNPQTIFFKVEYISCDNKMCMPPTTIDLSVKTQ